MLDLLIQIVTNAVSKVVESGIEHVSGKASSKRPLAVALIELYDATVSLEAASQAAYDAFRQIRDGEKVPLRIRVRDRLDALFRASEAFGTRVGAVYSRLGIYDPDLAATLVGKVFYGKFRMLTAVDLLLETVPRPVKTGRGLTDKVSIATALPEPSELHLESREHASLAALPAYSRPPEELNQQIADIRARVLRKLSKRELDITDKDDLEVALQYGQENIDRIRRARTELADFIRRSVPLTEILAE
jgi:hypothetical protein